MAIDHVGLAPGVDIIRTSFRDRPLHLPILRGREVALIDSGLVGTPRHAVLPYLAAAGLAPVDLSLVIVTHAHTDHYAGNEELLLASGQGIRFAAHRLDRDWIEDPARHTRQAQAPLVRWGLVTPEQVEQEVADCGNGVMVDHVLEGGEVFSLGDGLELEIVHLPGHTLGNIAVLDRRDGILLQGESIIGTAQYDTRGELLSCPNHEDTLAYLQTVAAVASLPFQTLVPSHLPLMDRGQAAAFLGDSLDFVLRFEGEVQERLQAAGAPVTTLGLWRSLGRLWDRYPHDLGLYALLEAHLRSLIARGLAQGSPDEGVSWLGGSDDLAPLAADARRAIAAM
ncbi:MAG: MBL fold metallo-hydrolase [Anaerolineae bacterium]